MIHFWHKLQAARRRYRWPIKWCVLILVVLFVLYPRPSLLVRHIARLRVMDALPDPREPALRPVEKQFDTFVAQQGIEGGTALLDAVQRFVYEQVPYAYDWEVWGVADYIPTVREIIEAGREDCDGRAVLAAALLRAKGIDAKLVAGNGHVWVATDWGETMSPIGQPSLVADQEGLQIDLFDFFNTRSIAFGIAVFPWMRELIILLTLWVLLLPREFRWGPALLALYLLCSGMMTIRLAGANIYAQHDHGIRWGWGQLLLAVIILISSGKIKKKDRPVGTIEAFDTQT